MDVYVIYHVLCVDIYVISLFVLMERKKQKNSIFPLCRVPNGTRQSWERQSWEADNQFPSFAECQSPGTQQRNFKKKILPSARLRHLAKKLKKRILCRVPPTWHSAKRPSQLTADFFFVKCLRGTRRVPDIWHSAKKPLPTDSLPSALCRVQ
jgi:hypothetical protein